MQEGKSVLFGKKDEFAIEIRPYNIPKKFYLRFWLKNKAIGDFKRGGSLDYLINGYFKFLNNTRDNLYQDEFNNLPDFDIFRNIFLYSVENLSPKEEDFYYNRMEYFGYIFADNQLNNYTIGIIHSVSKIKILVYEMDGKSEPRFYAFNIDKNLFCNAYKSFMMYAFENGVKKNGLFFPDLFSIEDIQ